MCVIPNSVEKLKPYNALVFFENFCVTDSSQEEDTKTDYFVTEKRLISHIIGYDYRDFTGLISEKHHDDFPPSLIIENRFCVPSYVNPDEYLDTDSPFWMSLREIMNDISDHSWFIHCDISLIPCKNNEKNCPVVKIVKSENNRSLIAYIEDKEMLKL